MLPPLILYFYPRPPRGGRRQSTSRLRPFGRFLSTPSARRATIAFSAPFGPPERFLSTPSARRATIAFSAPFGTPERFLSTPSARRATGQSRSGSKRQAISIHALREEGDAVRSFKITSHGNFYPRPPRGGRPYHLHNWDPADDISIHALREEGDNFTPETWTGRQLFLSTPSARRATLRQRAEHLPLRISIHALREEGDQGIRGSCVNFIISIHALREEGDQCPK